jgi:hypothetical protein
MRLTYQITALIQSGPHKETIVTRKTRKETPVVPDFTALGVDLNFIAPDRNYGKIEKLVLAVEEKLGTFTVEEMILHALQYTEEPLEDHRDRRAYRLKQAIQTLTSRTGADLVIAPAMTHVRDETTRKLKNEERPNCLVRSPTYMVPYLSGAAVAPEVAGLKHRHGRLGQRINDAETIIAEELARIDAGAPLLTDLRIHLAMAIIGPVLMTSLLEKVDTALAARGSGEDLI